MTCDQCTDRFSALMDGELGPDEERELRAHQAGCEECARAFEEMREVVAALHSLPEMEPPTGLYEELRGIPDAAPSPVTGLRRRARYVLAGLAAAAAALLMVWAGIDYYHGQSRTDTAIAPRVTAESAVREPDIVVEVPAEVAEAPEAVDVPVGEEAIEAERRAGEPEAAGRRERPAVADAPAVGSSAPSAVERWEIAEAPDFAESPVPAPPARTTRPEPSRTPSVIDPGGAGPVGPAGPAGPMAPAETRERIPQPGIAEEPEAARSAVGTGTLPMPRAEYLDMASAVSTRIGEGTPFTIAVRPPAEKVTGTIVPAAIIIETEENVARAQITVKGSEGLELLGLPPDGLLFDGPLTADHETVLSVRMVARQTGTRRVTMRVRSTDPIVDTELEVSMGEFREPVAARERPVQFDFVGTPIRDAVAEIVRESGMRVVVDTSVREATVTVRTADPIPAGAALQMIAEAAGCRLVEADGTVTVKPAGEEQ